MWRFASGQPHRPKAHAGFTLVEVLLGVFIAVGLLLVVLYFYSRAAELRAQLLEETERLAAVRLVMDRLTTELRCAHGPATARYPFVGQATALQFVTATHVRPTGWASGPSSRSSLPDIGLKLVSYSLGSHQEGSNTVVSGLIRTERSPVATSSPGAHPAPARPQQPKEPLAPEEEPSSTDLETSGSGSNVAVAPLRGSSSREPATARVGPVIEAIRFVRFRYRAASPAAPETRLHLKGRSEQTGASLEEWQETWTGPGLPQAVEVSLGTEPLPPDTAPEDYPYELFRRVIYLPGHAASVLWAEPGEAAESAQTQPETEATP